MFFEKVKLGAIGGGILGVIVTGISLLQGEHFRESFKMIPGCIVVGIGAVLWFTRDGDGSGKSGPAPDDVHELRGQLRTAIRHAAFNDSKGEHDHAAYWRAQAAEIESKLRSHGS